MSFTLDHETAPDPGAIRTMMTHDDDDDDDHAAADEDDHSKTTSSSSAQTTNRGTRGSIHHKRGAWRQMALRTREDDELNPHHQERMLHILQQAAKEQASVASNNHNAVDSGTATLPSKIWLDDQFKNIPLQEQALVDHVQYNKNGAAAQAYCNHHGTSSSLFLSPNIDKLDLDTAAKRLQTYYRRVKNIRRTSLHDSMQQGTTAPLCHNEQEISIICLPFVSETQPPPLLEDRQVSKITMRDIIVGDSTPHHPQGAWWSTTTGQSSVDWSSSWFDEDSDTDDDVLFLPDELVLRPSRAESKQNSDDEDWYHDTARLHLDKTNSIGGGVQKSTCAPPTTVRRHHVSNTFSEKNLSSSPKHDSSWSSFMTMLQIHDDIQMTTATGHASLNSYLRHPTVPRRSPLSSHNHSKELQHIDHHDLIDMMLQGDDDHDDDHDDAPVLEGSVDSRIVS